MAESWFCLPPLEHSDYLGNWGLQSPETPVQVLPRGCNKDRSCLIPTLATQVSTSTGRLLVHLRHQAAASRNRPCRSWTHPAGLGKPVGGRVPWHFGGTVTQAGLSVQRAALTCRTGCGVNMSPALSSWGQTMPSADCLFINLPSAHCCLSLSKRKLNGLLPVSQTGCLN